jgi:pilus assembly protein CpaE
VTISSPDLAAVNGAVAAVTPAPGGGYELVVVEPDPKLRSRLAMQLGAPTAVATCPDIPAMAERLRPRVPAVVVFGPGLSDGSGLADIEGITRRWPEVAAILVAAELSTGLLQQALRAGIKDVLVSPTEAQQLRESVERVAHSFAIVPTGPAPVTGEGTERGQVITVSSTKGGAGKSVVATNLAVALARRSDRPVVLVDADLQFGDVAVMMRLTANHTVVDAVAAMGRLDAQLLNSLLVRHDPSGLLILPAPIEPSFAERVTGADMIRILEVLQSFCAYVVVDTPAQFNDVVLALIDHSDNVVLVAGMDIPNIKNMKLGLQTLRLLSVPEAKLRLLLNRADAKIKLDVGEVERALGLKAECLVPVDVVVPQTVNKGVPLVLDAPRSEVAKAFERLADLFAQGAAAPVAAKSRSRFGF